MSGDSFLITGAMGCIGSWVLRNLVRERVRIVALDLAEEPVRPRMLLTPDKLARINFVQGNIADPNRVQELIEQQEITHIIHLAAVQVPPCRSNPPLGARINVVGTVNVFEAARRCADQVRGLVYASSVTALGPPSLYSQRPVPDDVPQRPATLYGVYKQTNEHVARLYWQNWRLSSVGLRPGVVFGVGRDQGSTSDIAKAILAAAAGRPYRVGFDGYAALQYADDVARMFIGAARTSTPGAVVCNVRNDVVEVADFVALLKDQVPDARITCASDHPLPFPADLDDSGLRRVLGPIPHTPLAEAVRDSLARFRTLLAGDLIDLGQLKQ